ncbi:hypothetical protein J6590_045855 [Homalodisca vitripennis]|nr:hypothetical protein J6590_045855 [Homalodisca vitripennis]
MTLYCRRECDERQLMYIYISQYPNEVLSVCTLLAVRTVAGVAPRCPIPWWEPSHAHKRFLPGTGLSWFYGFVIQRFRRIDKKAECIIQYEWINSLLYHTFSYYCLPSNNVTVANTIPSHNNQHMTHVFTSQPLSHQLSEVYQDIHCVYLYAMNSGVEINHIENFMSHMKELAKEIVLLMARFASNMVSLLLDCPTATLSLILEQWSQQEVRESLQISTGDWTT